MLTRLGKEQGGCHPLIVRRPRVGPSVPPYPRCVRSLLVLALATLLLTTACSGGDPGSDDPGTDDGGTSLSGAEADEFVDQVGQLTREAFAAAAEQVGQSAGDGSAPPKFVSCSEQGEGAVELQTRGTLQYDGDREAGALDGVAQAWTDLGLEVTPGDDELTAVRTLQGIEVQLTVGKAVRMRDGSGQQLRYLNAITPRCVDVGAEKASDLTR